MHLQSGAPAAHPRLLLTTCAHSHSFTTFPKQFTLRPTFRHLHSTLKQQLSASLRPTASLVSLAARTLSAQPAIKHTTLPTISEASAQLASNPIKPTMPYEDLLCRRERSAPVFDASDPAEIERYFNDLEFLFLKHHVLADHNKKLAAVRYPSIAAERLWRTAGTFRDTMCSYKDFKSEIIALYPECKGVHSLMPDLGRFVVSDGLAATSLWIPPEV